MLSEIKKCLSSLDFQLRDSLGDLIMIESINIQLFQKVISKQLERIRAQVKKFSLIHGQEGLKGNRMPQFLYSHQKRAQNYLSCFNLIKQQLRLMQAYIQYQQIYPLYGNLLSEVYPFR
ncbi:unnamed protein product [Paramecium octaurelia]|uniref:Uncharacterized protein n=1 Tax=Paramecium octaurelia TaxID=43137 RepID=A0A8S1S313_PAROT|nr:unnamed protein product [Paramecium octaurelia]